MKRSYGSALLMVLLLGVGLFIALRMLRSESPRPKVATRTNVSFQSARKAVAVEQLALSSQTETRPPAQDLDAEARLRAFTRATMVRANGDMPLRLAEARAKLTLNSREHDRLLDDILDFQQAKILVDQPLIKVTSFNGKELVLQIPAHPEQGATVKAAFAQQIREDFSSDLAEDIIGAIDTELENLFDCFGKYTQTYTIEKPRDDSQTRVIMKAEINGEEDVGKGITQRKASNISNSGWYGRDVLDIDFAVLLPSVNTYFPKDPTQLAPPFVPAAP